MPGPVRDAADAYQQMEAMLVRQLLQSSGAFKASDVAGGQVRADMFVETLADAVAKGGGLGIAKLLENSLSNPLDKLDAEGDPLLAGKKVSPQSTAHPLSPSAPHFPGTSPAGLKSGALPAVLELPEAETVTSSFGRRPDPIDGGSKYHTGIDLRAPEGSPIKVAADGIVKNAGHRGGYGNAVEIDHGGGVTTLYAHASELLVTEGEKVKEGQVIGRAGMTGRATGPHLHFEVRQHDRPVDPTRALNTYRERVDASIAVKPHVRGAP